MGVTLDDDARQYLGVFEDVTGVDGRDCLITEGGNRLLIVVERGGMGEAIGPGGRTVQRFEDRVDAQVRLVEARTILRRSSQTSSRQRPSTTSPSAKTTILSPTSRSPKTTTASRSERTVGRLMPPERSRIATSGSTTSSSSDLRLAAIFGRYVSLEATVSEIDRPLAANFPFGDLSPAERR